MMPERIVVIGADAAGMSAAHQANRLAARQGRELEIIALEKTPFTSYSACGLPYWIAGEVSSYDELVARTPEEHRALGVDVRTGTTAVSLDLSRRRVYARTDDHRTESLPYDQLVIASGASPVVPEWARDARGDLLRGVAAVKDPDDGELWISSFLSRTPQDERPVVIVGGGFIGIEMAEAVRRRGFPAVLITRSRVMSAMEPEMSSRIEKALESANVTIFTNDQVLYANADDAGAVSSVVLASGARIECAQVVLALGIRPALDFIPDATLARDRSGALLPDERGQVAPGVWAAGDCCAVRHRISDAKVFVPLGTHANKQGKVVGTNIAGGRARFDGVLGTSITRFVGDGVHLEISRTGLSVAEAHSAGFDPIELTTEGRTASGYMAHAASVAVSIVGDRPTGRLLGAQIVGGAGAAKRIDTVAAALWMGALAEDLACMDLAYAPPFATVWEVVQLAARRLSDRIPAVESLTGRSR